MTEWTLYSSSRSPFVRKTIMAAHCAGLIERIDFVEVQTNPMTPSVEVLKHNPLGMIPTLLLADSEMLTGSDAILDYFNEVAPEAGLIPQGGQARREVLRRQTVADGAMDKAVKWLDERFRDQNEDTRSHINGYSGALLSVADWFNHGIVTRERPDAGDLALYCLLGYLEFRFPECVWRDGRDALVSWYEELDKHPAAAATVPH